MLTLLKDYSLADISLPLSLIYLGMVNLLGFSFMAIDKYKAKKQLYRIPERTLFSIAFLGGSFGVWLAGRLFRHKTLHKSFKYGIPAIMIFTYSAAIFVFYYLNI